MPRRQGRFCYAIILLLSMLQLAGCSDDPESPEAEIRRFIDSGVRAAENRSVDGLSELVHADYLGQRGRNREQLRLLLRVYFMRHKNIHLFTRIDSIEILGNNQASVKLHVAMAGTVISDVDALASLSARLYRFELHLVKQEDWLLQHASWAPASIGSFK